MIKVAAALNSFASEPEATAPPSEEIFVLTAGQLEQIISRAVARAQAPLLERIERLEATEARLDALEEERGVGPGEGGEDAPDSHKRQDNLLQIVQDLQEENIALNAKLEVFQEIVPWVEALSKKMARLQAQVEAQEKKPQPLQKDRGEILRALIAANGGKMLAKDARKKMHLSRSRFSELLAMVKAEIEARPYHLNKSWQVLVLR